MDPHQKYCYLGGEPGLQFDLTTLEDLDSLDDIADTLDGFCSKTDSNPGFEWCPPHRPLSSDSSGSEDDVQTFTLEPASLLGSASGYPGTIMRLPLRTDAMAPHSDIKTVSSLSFHVYRLSRCFIHSFQ